MSKSTCCVWRGHISSGQMCWVSEKGRGSEINRKTKQKKHGVGECNFTWHDTQQAGLCCHSRPHADALVPTGRALSQNAIGPVGVPDHRETYSELTSRIKPTGEFCSEWLPELLHIFCHLFWWRQVVYMIYNFPAETYKWGSTVCSFQSVHCMASCWPVDSVSISGSNQLLQKVLDVPAQPLVLLFEVKHLIHQQQHHP